MIVARLLLIMHEVTDRYWNPVAWEVASIQINYLAVKYCRE
jgi:hypothetical protein